jgi:Sec-independent protein translocase protein TatA
MMKLLGGMGWMAAAGTAAILAFAEYRSRETGRDLSTVLKNLPDEFKQSQSEWQERLRKALEEGKLAANRREAEIDSELREAGAKENRDREETPDFIV